MATTPTNRVTMLARRLRVDIDTATYPASAYEMLLGVEELNPIIEPRTEDDENYDDEGWAREVSTGANWRIECKIKHSTSADGATVNTVQAFLRAKFLNTAASDMPSAEFGVRIYDRAGRTSGYEYEGRAYVKTWERDGNASGDTEVINLVLQGQGPITPITNPVADLTPTVTGLSPATGDEAGGELVNIFGMHYAGVSAVTFGANPADDFTVVSPTHIVAIAPTGTAGTVAVRVTTPAGQSADTAADNYVYTS